MLSAATGIALPASCFDDPNPAGPGHPPRRLLQVRSQLLERGLPERRRLPHRHRGAERLRQQPFGDHPAPVRCRHGALLGPDLRRRCDRRARRLLRTPGLARGADALTFAARSPETDYELHLALDAGTPPGTSQLVQQPHPARPGAHGQRRHHQGHAVPRRDPRRAGALRDHGAQCTRRSDPGPHRDRPVPARLPLHRRLGPRGRRAHGADLRRGRARTHLDRRRRRSGRAPAPSACCSASERVSPMVAS